MAKTLHYNFLTNPTLTGSEHPIATSPDLSITRATKATMVDADGYIREVQAEEARFTGATWAANYLRQSDNADDAVWTKNDTTASGTTITANAGTFDASISQTAFGRTADIGESTILSCKVKAGTNDYVWMGDRGHTGLLSATFNLSTGAVIGNTNADGVGISGPDGDGYYTIYLAGIRPNAGAISLNLALAPSASHTADWPSNTWAGTETIDAKEFQLEITDAAKLVNSAYIETTTDFKTSLTGTSTKGILVEEARTNICLQSEDFSTTWSAAPDGVVNTNQTTAPDGSSTADRLIDDSGGTGAVSIYVQQNVTVDTSTAYTFSVFAKKDQLDWIAIQLRSFTTPVNSIAYFDLTNGAFGTVDAGFDANSFEDFGNGWYRINLTFTTDSTDTLGTIRIYVADANDNVAVADDGTSSIYVWGAQLEAGAFPTSYIATTTASVTRNEDTVSTTDVSWYNTDAEGTFYSNASVLSLNNPTAAYIFDINDGTDTNRVRHYTDAQEDGTWNVLSSGADASLAITNAYNKLTSVKSAMTIALNDVEYYSDGTRSGTGDQNVGLPTGITNLQVGRGRTGGALNGHIAEIAYFNERLANATLEDYSLNGLPTAFPGTVAGDGGHIWPARSNDPRWAQIITDSGITPSGNFIDDVHAALEAMASTTGAMDDLWKKVKAVYSITDTSEPFTY